MPLITGTRHSLRKAGIGGNDRFTKLLLGCNGDDASTTFSDRSGSANTMTANGNAQVDTAVSRFGSGAYLGDGTGDRVSTPSSADWNFGAAASGDFTVDLWVRFSSTQVTNGFVATNAGGVGGWGIYYSTAAGGLTVYDGASKTWAWTPSTGVWYHIAVVRSGSSVIGFIDGVSQGTIADGDWNNDSIELSIGALDNTGSAVGIIGWLDEVRISKGIARWTANFVPPNAQYDNG